jgi:hypothetical protein
LEPPKSKHTTADIYCPNLTKFGFSLPEFRKRPQI